MHFILSFRLIFRSLFALLASATVHYPCLVELMLTGRGM